LKRAIIIHKDERGRAHLNVARILDFFGVPWISVQADELPSAVQSLNDFALIGPIDELAAALMQVQSRDNSYRMPAVMFAFAGKDRVESERALRRLSGASGASLVDCPTGERIFCISRDAAEITGPMSGVEFSARAGDGACVLTGTEHENVKSTTIISVDGAPAFLRFASGGTSTFFSSSDEITNIDEPVGTRFYDVKNHFLAAAPFVMFVKSVFREVAWREQELGACLIIDDPLLKARYGRCDFRVLLESMQQHGFTTNISFIPWNWRRTSQTSAEFFRGAGPFSVSIHGCDHTNSEFGDTSPGSIQSKAMLAMKRMEAHESRTGIHHDRVMVFPQGVFSSVCPEVLKRSGYSAAVNTETIPVDIDNECTRICDVWDVAITRYGDFPIFTRRYARHGLENFAFDLLLGKPCLIVSHHEFFKDKCHTAVELIEKLHALSCTLQWRSLGEVVQRACRLRNDESGLEIEMFGTELLFRNPMNAEVDVVIRKKERETDAVIDVLCSSASASFMVEAGQIVVRDRIWPHAEFKVKVHYGEQSLAKPTARPLSVEMLVALRRIASEVRDEYLA
jgi:hypothetical protein